MKKIHWSGLSASAVLLLIILLAGKNEKKEGIEYIFTDKAPRPIGPYSQAVRYDDFVYLSGQIALGADGIVDTADISTETRLVMNNLNEVLKAAGTGMDRVVKTTIYLSDMKYFPEVNKVYGSFFTAGKAPARETIAVKSLPKAARVEISMVAAE